MDLPHASGSLQGQNLLAIEIGFLLVVINDDLIAVFIGHAAHAVRQDFMAYPPFFPAGAENNNPAKRCQLKISLN